MDNEIVKVGKNMKIILEFFNLFFLNHFCQQCQTIKKI